MNQTQVISQTGKVRQQLAHPDAALALLGELEHRRRDQLPLAPGHCSHPLPFTNRFRQFRLEELVEIRLVVEQVHLARRTGHEEEDDALRLRLALYPERRRSLQRLRNQRSEGGSAETHAGVE